MRTTPPFVTSRATHMPMQRKFHRNSGARVSAWLALVALVGSLMSFASPEKAHAFGPQFVISPSIVPVGGQFTATLDGISSSDFCGPSPEGSGYYVEIMLQNIEMEVAVPLGGSPGESAIDPRTTDSFSLTTKPIPDWFPPGWHLAVAYCRSTNGGWLSNNVPAVDFQITAGEPAPAEQPTTAPTEEPESAAPPPDASVEEEEETAIAAKEARPKLMQPRTISFGLLAPDDNEDVAVRVEGDVPQLDGDVEVLLVGSEDEEQSLGTFTPDRDSFDQALALPGGIEPGTFTLKAFAKALCGTSSRPCEVTAEATIIVTESEVTLKDVTVPRSTGALSSLSLIGGGLLALGVILATVSLWERRRRAKHPA